MAVTVPLNTFKTITYFANSKPTIVYTAPTNIATVILLAQMSNVDSANTITVSSNFNRNGVATSLIQNLLVPTSDTAILLAGKLILQTGDSLVVSANTYGSNNLVLANSAHFLLSFLETSTV
jgi:hypothetical protein